MKDYSIFLSSDQTLVENKETKLTVIDVNTQEHMEVIAVVSSSNELPDAHRLWVRIDDLGDVRKSVKPRFIRVLERMRDPVETQRGKSRTTDDRLSREADSLLSTSERYFKDIIATSEQWIWEMDINARYTYVSSTVEKVLGYKPKDVIGSTFFQFLMKKDSQKAKELLQGSKKDKAGFRGFVHRKCHTEGKIIWAETTGFPVLNKNGKLRGWRGVEQDVTKRKQIEEKFHHHQQLLAVLNILNNVQIRADNLDLMLSNISTELRQVFTADKVTIFIPALDSKGIFLTEEGTKSSIVRKKLLHLTKDGGYGRKMFLIGDSTLSHHFKVWDCSRSSISYSKRGGYRSYMSIPLKGQDGILAVIEFSKSEKNGFSNVDLELMDAIGARIGLIIERACYCAALQDREQDLSMMSARLVHAQEDERHRISRILHDEVGQFLSSASMILKSVELELDLEPKMSKSHLAEVRPLIQKAMRRSRDLSSELRPLVLETIGLIPALRNLVTHYQDVFGVKIGFISSGIHERFPENIELAFYRVGEEALRNVTRYAKARNVSVKLVRSGNKVVLMVRDDGIGFDYRKEGSFAKGLGLKIMKERMSSIGADLRITSKPNKGTCVVASLFLDSGKMENGNQGFHRR